MKVLCPICKCELEGDADELPHRPFCSERCKTIDLGNWLDGVYRFSRPLRDDEDDDIVMS